MRRRDADDCFLCEQPVKTRRFTFYSGVKKGGTTHELLSCTVTFFERWSDLTMHEIEVCRDCQQRLWKEKHFVPMALCGAGAAVMALIALLGVLLPAPAMWLVVGLGGFGALALGALFVVCRQQYQTKPKHSEVEPLVIRAAIPKLPPERHTYLTTDQYIERVQKGIIG